MTKIASIGALLAALWAGSAAAQDLNAMNNAFNARMNAQMGAMQNSIIQQNLNNPQVMAMYRQHLAQGGRMSPQQFAYAYAATGGFSAQGYANYQATSNQIAAQQQQAMQGYRAAQDASRQAIGAWNQGFSNNMQEAGRNLMGQGSYVDPRSGGNVALNYLPSAGPSYNPQTGMYYAQDGAGRYWASRGDGYWVPMAPAYGR
ncbi:MAG: hypothetical protein JNK46_20680 [Methylobacteriaceae bacterium]|nr:hypothetical protein [Methylobacteriaceae bacterium]